MEKHRSAEKKKVKTERRSKLLQAIFQPNPAFKVAEKLLREQRKER